MNQFLLLGQHRDCQLFRLFLVSDTKGSIIFLKKRGAKFKIDELIQ